MRSITYALYKNSLLDYLTLNCSLIRSFDGCSMAKLSGSIEVNSQARAFGRRPGRLLFECFCSLSSGFSRFSLLNRNC